MDTSDFEQKKKESGYLLDKARFDIEAMQYEKIDTTIKNPLTCTICETIDPKKEPTLLLCNLAKQKRQVSIIICNDCKPIFDNLPNENPLDSKIQNLLRLLFGEDADKMIKFQQYKRKSAVHASLYTEYYALLKWHVEEYLLLALGNMTDINEFPTTQAVKNENNICLICEDLQVEKTIDIFSPLKKNWLIIDSCSKCEKKFKLDVNDMEFEIKSLYFDKIDDYENLNKRDLMIRLSIQIKEHQQQVLFLDPRFSDENTGHLLNILGVDENNSLTLNHKKVIEKKDEKEEDVDSSGINN